jgi:hypothetical protein
LSLNGQQWFMEDYGLRPGILPAIPRISLPKPPFENIFIIFCISSN